MASYIDGSLIDGESVRYIGNISKWSIAGYIFSVVFFAVLSLPLLMAHNLRIAGFITLGIAAVFALVAYVKLKTTELAITNKRVIAKFGLISRQTIELNIVKVESIQVHQGILGRIFNYGSLVIAGGGNPQAPIPGISNPLGFRKAFMEAQDASMSR